MRRGEDEHTNSFVQDVDCGTCATLYTWLDMQACSVQITGNLPIYTV